jgi:hypothetical protein
MPPPTIAPDRNSSERANDHAHSSLTTLQYIESQRQTLPDSFLETSDRIDVYNRRYRANCPHPGYLHHTSGGSRVKISSLYL